MALSVISLLAPVVAWLWGGRPERFGAGAALWLHFAFAHHTWMIGDVYVDSTIEDIIGIAAFGWLFFRSDRWWPFVAITAHVLSLLVHVLTMVTDITWDAAVSARVGHGLLFYVALMAGVAERWLAGEARVNASSVWRRRSGLAGGVAP